MDEHIEYSSICPQCGQLIRTDEILCPQCGHRVSYADFAVDLGLSVKWAKCNLKSEVPEDNSSAFSGFTDTSVSEAWGMGWRMPTKEEFEELIRKCKISGESRNGVWGEKIIGPNGNSIFIPIFKHKEYGDFGAYFTSTKVPDKEDLVYAHVFAPNHIGQMSLANIHAPLMIRPVYEDQHHVIEFETISADNSMEEELQSSRDYLMQSQPIINNFFPLRGVVLGQTRANEIKTDKPLSKTHRGDYILSVDGNEVYFFTEEGDGMRIISAFIPSMKQITFNDWNHIGFNKYFSFEESYRYFKRNRFDVEIVGNPLLHAYEGRKSFSAELKVIAHDKSVCLIIRFGGGETDNPSSRGTIESLSIAADINKEPDWIAPDNIVKMWDCKHLLEQS